MEKVYILDNEDIKELTAMVAEALTYKARLERKVQDMRTRTMFGNTNFWFHVEDSGSIILCYDQHPSMWDQAGIRATISHYERIYLEKRGIAFFDF
jgi:hypothetical protein